MNIIKYQFNVILILFCILTNVNKAQYIQVGTGTSTTDETGPTPFGTFYHDDKTQMLYLASELQAQGLLAGNISKIAFYVTTAEDQTMNDLTISMGHSSSTSLSGFKSVSYEYSNSQSANGGWDEFPVSFNWDGTSNIVVQVCFDNTDYTSSSRIQYTSTSFTSVWSRYSDSGAGYGCDMTGGSGYTKRANIRLWGETCTVTTNIEIPSTLEFGPDNDWAHITPVFNSLDVCNTNVTWHSTNYDVAWFYYEGDVVAGIPGTAEIWVVSEDGSVESNHCVVTVSNGLDPDDYAALVAIHNTIDCFEYNIDGFYDEMGVIDVDENGKVIELELVGCAYNEIPVEVFSLDQLQSLHLSYTGITAIPEEISSLTNLAYLDVSFCQLTDLPALPASLEYLNVEYNYLDFDDLVQLIPAMENGLLSEVHYSSQDIYYNELPIITNKNAFLGYDHVFTTTDLGVGVEYDLLIPGEDIIVHGSTSNTITLPNISSESAATYQIKASHPRFPELVLSSGTVDIEVINKDDYDAAVAIYNNMNGPNWNNSPNMSDVFSKWDFCDPNIYVLGLHLDNNNVKGEFPPELSYLTHIDGIWASNNNISGNFPVDFIVNLDQFTNLSEIQIQNNELSGQIPAQLFSCPSLHYLRLDGNNFSGELDQAIVNTTVDHIELNDNNLEGKVPQGLLTAGVLDLRNNNFTELPDISTFTGTSLDLSMNNFDFEDFLPYKDILPATNIIHYPQKPFIVTNNVFEEFEGATITMSIDVIGDSYQWYHDGALISGAGASELTIGPVSTSNIGRYHCVVGHNDFSFTLVSKEIIVYVKDEAGLVFGVDIQDYRALDALYNSTDGDNWDNSWDLEQPATWQYLEYINGRVSEIDVWDNNLTGTLPPEIGLLSSMNSMYLGYNNISGSLPAELGNLTSLEQLYLNDNSFTGTIPVTMSNLTNLTDLYINNNDISGSFPEFLWYLPNLWFCDASNNNLSGPLTISQSILIDEANLSHNELTGTIPAEIFLKDSYFDLSYNKFDALPQNFDIIANSMGHFDISYNNLSFDDLAQYESVYQDYIIYSPQNDLDVAQSFFKTTAGQTIQLEVLSSDAGCNYVWKRDGVDISGDQTVPDFSLTVNSATEAGTYICEITHPDLPNLTLYSKPISVFMVDGNGLIGGVPEAEFDALVALYNATDGDNWTHKDKWLTTEPVNDWWGVTTSGGNVVDIALYGNNLSGVLPIEIGELSQLSGLILFDNDLYGNIPSSIGNMGSLISLMLNNNQLSGSLPPEIANCTNLEYLYLENNDLVGQIPLEYENLPIVYFVLSNNLLSGPLPQFCFEGSYSFDLSYNNFAGSIPTEWGNYYFISEINLSHNMISGTLPANLPVGTLDLSYNNFSGELALDFELLDWSVINFSNNAISGVTGDATDLHLSIALLNNYLDFFDVEPYYQHPDFDLNYDPQNDFQVGINLYTIHNGQDLVIDIPEAGGPNCRYQWKKDGADLNNDPLVPDLTIADGSINDDGIYEVVITNELVTNLALTSEPITVTFSAYAPVTNIVPLVSEYNIVIGGNDVMEYTVEPAYATNKSVTWSTDAPVIATVAQDGTVTGVGLGTCTITATSVDNPLITANFTIVVESADAQSVTINQNPVSVIQGQTITLTATVLPVNTTDKTVTWQSLNTDIATIDEISGLVTGIQIGTAQVACYTHNNIQALATIYVLPIPVAGVSLNKTSTTIIDGSTEQLYATILPADAYNKSVTWSSSNTAVATVDNTGLVTAVAPGSVSITVETTDGGHTDNCTVTVDPLLVDEIQLSVDELQMVVGNTYPVSATANPVDASDNTLIWEIQGQSQTGMANISQGDNFTATLEALIPGTANLVVYSADGGATQSIPLTLYASTYVGSVSIPETEKIARNEIKTIVPDIFPVGSTYDQHWQSSNATSVSVESSNGTLSGIAAGQATISLDINNGQFIEQCLVTAYAHQLGDVDYDETIWSVDAAIILRAAAGGDLSYWDVPQRQDWDAERIYIANVYRDGTGAINSMDAQILQQYLIGMHPSLPVYADPAKNNRKEDIDIKVENNNIVFSAATPLFAFELEAVNNKAMLGQPVKQTENMRIETNIGHGTYRLAMAGAHATLPGQTALAIPVENMQGGLTLSMQVNGQHIERTIQLSTATDVETTPAPGCKVYPNPFRDRVYIQPENLDNGVIQIYIYSLDGTLLHTAYKGKYAPGAVYSWAGQTSSGTMAGKGLYFIKIQTEKGVLVKRIVIE